MLLLFWVSGFAVFHTYLLYPLTLPFLIKRFGRDRRSSGENLSAGSPAKAAPTVPKVSILIAAYNEEKIIREKIQNCLDLEYPEGQLEVLIGSDASTDGTNALLETAATQYASIRCFLYEERSGKPGVLNKLVKEAAGELLIFCDANSMFLKNAVYKLVSNFGDDRVGCACGRLILQDKSRTHLGAGESLYWKMESEIKRMEGDLGVVVGANGAIYAIRKELYRDIPQNRKITDDFYVTSQVLQQGWEAVYEPLAIATEETSLDVYGEFKRKVRIGEANFNFLLSHLKMVSLKTPLLAYSFISHKLLRWTAPLLLLFLFLVNAYLFQANPASIFFRFTLLLQCVFYGLAALGFAKMKLGTKGKPWVALPFYFVSMNAALLLGLLQSLKGSEGAGWERVERTK